MTADLDIKKLKILVVDDHMMMRNLIVQALRAIGVENIDYAQTGDAAVKNIMGAANNFDPYHIVFLDWHMPGMYGIDVLKACRQEKRLDKTAFIMLTAEQEEKNIISAIEAGATSYLIKPVSRDSIEKNLTKVFAWIEKMNPDAPKKDKTAPVTTLAPETMVRELRPVISRGIKNIFSEMFATEIVPENQLSAADHKKLVCIGVLHQKDVSIALRFFFDEELLRPLLGNIYSPEFLNDPAIYEDAACEIVNILCAQVKAFLNNHGYSLVLDQPRMGIDNQQDKNVSSIMNVRFSINEDQCFLVDLSKRKPGV